MDKNKYRVMRTLDELSNWQELQYDDNKALVDTIHDNYHSMTPKEIKILAMKCLSETHAKKILLQYEFERYMYTPTNMSIIDFSKIVKKIFDKYYWKVGGYYFTNNEWVMHTHNCRSKMYELKNNEIIFDNMIHVDYIDDDDTYYFLKYIMQIIKSIANNIDVSIDKKKYERDKMIVIMIKCVENRK